MKSFKEYLTESKKVYEFKVRFAGEIKPEGLKKIKMALEQYKLESCSTPRRTPIQESPIDFPSLKNTNVTIFDVTLAYPTTSLQVKSAIASAGFLDSQISVRNLKEEEELAINHEHDKRSNEALLTKDYEADKEGQSLVGEKQKMALLKELSKTKHTGTSVDGKKVKLPTAKGL